MDTKEAVEAAASIPQDLALIKVENETMMSAAAARPRDLTAIAKGLVAQIREFPAFAQTVLYSRPVGKDEETGGQKFATGLSIRAAEAVAEAYGFNRVWSEIRILPDGNATVSASFTDFQRCRVTSASVLVSRMYKARKGGMVQHPQDRFLDVVCKAAQSKVIRDVIVRSIPPSLKTTLELAVRQSIKVSPKVVQQVVEYFSGLGVAQGELETLLGALAPTWSDVHVQRLRELRTALEDSETTVEDTFGRRPDRPEPVKAAPEKGKQSSLEDALKNPTLADAPLTPEEMAEADRQHEARQQE